MTADNLSALTSPQRVVEKCHFRGQKNRTQQYSPCVWHVDSPQPAWLLALTQKSPVTYI